VLITTTTQGHSSEKLVHQTPQINLTSEKWKHIHLVIKYILYTM